MIAGERAAGISAEGGAAGKVQEWRQQEVKRYKNRNEFISESVRIRLNKILGDKQAAGGN